MTPVDLDQRAEALLALALCAVTAIRDRDPATVAHDLEQLPPADLRDVAVLLAALVPEDRTPRQLLAWWLYRGPVVDLPAVEPPWESWYGLRDEIDPIAA